MRISVLMANWRGAAFLPEAIASVLRQSHADLELIVVDDASGDDSVAILREAAAADPRVRLIEMERNAGPSAARNRALDAATGDWLAIMDSDDVLHPDRLARLLSAAEALGVEAVADDMLFFGETPDASGRTLLQVLHLTGPMQVDATTFVEANGGTGDLPPLGYLKPLVRRDAWDGLRYDETLRVGEDYDLYLRLLLSGARLVLLPEALYLYRRHSGSISHRLSVAALEPLIAAHDRSAEGQTEPVLVEALRRRRAGLEAMLAFEHLVAAIKGRRPAEALSRLARRPLLARELLRSLGERRNRRAAEIEERHPLSIVLTADPRPVSETERLVAVPPLQAPEAIHPWPPAQQAALLSDLAARHELEICAEGREGLFWLWLVPRWRRAEVVLPPRHSAPLPPGAERVSHPSLMVED
ncbi:glycosyltransferase [Cereibacter sphaeroides]|uniref:glycosyltransferase family 2 protein n=1 Tax=Cereibacter sphaeroides TaxID=1063 RepID=UPI001F452538|nr:glycosyltransferase [Cereibacter sphaeroides]MCE6953353.1 glycosyltransferase [Cereibacter sphaeroides]